MIDCWGILGHTYYLGTLDSVRTYVWRLILEKWNVGWKVREGIMGTGIPSGYLDVCLESGWIGNSFMGTGYCNLWVLWDGMDGTHGRDHQDGWVICEFVPLLEVG